MHRIRTAPLTSADTVDTVRSDAAASGFLRETPMTFPHPRNPDDDADESSSPPLPLEELAEELTGEPASSISEEGDDDTRLTEAELEAAAGVQSPPGRID
jgi:hypothetical protein